MEMLRNMATNEQQTLIRQIEDALAGVSQMPAFLTTMHSAGENVSKTC